MSPAGKGGRLLFVSYDGVLGGPGRSQVLPYLRGYRESGWSVHLISFEKPHLLAEEATRNGVEIELEAAQVRWTVLPYRRSMLRDFVAGLRAVRRAAREDRPDVVHARSYVPALFGWLGAKPFGARLLFDMRGLWPDERVDGGLWSRLHPLYLLWKRLERVLLRKADGVVVLSHAGARLLREEGLLPVATPLEVIPCGADLEHFRPGGGGDPPAPLRAFAGKRIYAFLGATGTWYLLPEMLDFAAAAVRADPDARALFLTEDPAGAVVAGLASRGVPVDRYIVTRVPHAEVPRWIAPSFAGVFFIRPCRSKKASCPTKLAEFLGCGIPVVINDGIGDTADLVREANAGVVIERYDDATFERARRELGALQAAGGLAERCRREAECRLDVGHGSRTFPSLAARITSR